MKQVCVNGMHSGWWWWYDVMVQIDETWRDRSNEVCIMSRDHCWAVVVVVE